MNFFGAQAINLMLFSTFLRNVMTRNGSKCVVVIEDLQWMDSVSWKLFKFLTQYPTNTMIVATTRSLKPIQTIGYVDLLKSGFNVSRIKLGPLSRRDLDDLVHKRVHKQRSGEQTTKMLGLTNNELVDRLQKFSNGFPFLASELLKELRDADYAFVPKFDGDRPQCKLQEDPNDVSERSACESKERTTKARRKAPRAKTARRARSERRK